ncbi:bifunctional helix-turn-helix transcriptional regulator/GNAT family N-acetyltransferase [Zhouia spongiae]|uniref:Bifunctional helix-turn-helix transcriptional regulator/GNAT family N-acetyltransferase n=1 Tax=Zhouia spongiae TaxID=2202721 RepID=A0ABY3YLE6_9FLAO|nr:helix-turn-helix domain-containing GNAT family N-acetyltransferase [Zhouia spongiae]UNY97983.1 bifunctional helix-turn-helix transcriptional regulator/GNAT family N-acetyltransferase [Zhouia spongiae]
MEFNIDKEIGLGSRLKRTSDLMMKEIREVYLHYSYDFDPYLFPVFAIINKNEEITTKDICETLSVSQPAITQAIYKLKIRGLIEIAADNTDKRKKNISPSVKGKSLYKSLIPLWKSMDSCVKRITHYTSDSLIEHLDKLEEILQQQKLSKMIIQYHDENKLEDIDIIRFHPKYINAFKELNLEWLKAYFVVEPYDIKILENAENHIINKGGYIFFARHNENIVGTVALIKIREGVYELSKMAVSPKHRGLKIGQKLMQYAIDFARDNKWEKLILYSNTKLENAIHIYRKYGFKEVTVEEDCVYLRCNIKMELPVQ